MCVCVEYQVQGVLLDGVHVGEDLIDGEDCVRVERMKTMSIFNGDNVEAETRCQLIVLKL